ncbi:MAG: hypothetical protein LBJ08_02695, partial [Bifidobacteriaceae bacterium]|nr:hypothetical protein [Bifidobacteriaceae bacterium]
MRSFRHSATAAIAATALAAALALTAGPPAQAAEQTIAVDVSQTTAPSHAGVGRGFLYGLSFDGTQPADPILGPIKPTSFRSGGEIDQAGSLGWHEGGEATFLPRYQAFAAQTARVTNPPYAAYMDMIVSDLWGSDGPAAGHREYARPCDEVAGAYDCTDWVDFLTSLIGHLGTDGLLNNQVRFDIWNEPADNAGFWPRLREQYWLMWDTGVRTIRALYPQAVIVGPSSGTYNGTREQLYLDHFHTESTMPDVWNWHFSTDPVADAVNMRARLVAKDPAYATIPLTMNEYLLNNSGTNEQTAGHLAWYLARLQRTEISGAAHAIWNNCCGSGRLCSALTMESAQLRTTGEYWVYEASASATGQVVQSVGAVGGVDVLATRDDTAKKIQLLMGARANSGSRFDGTATAQIAGLDDAPAIAGAGRVRVTVKHLANGRLDAPVTVSSVVVPVVDGAVSVPVAWADYHDAYTVTLTSAEERQFAVDDGSYGNRLDQFAFGPGWSAATASNAAGRSLTRASGPATAVFTFAGSAIDLAVLKGPDQGIFTVSLDGGAPESVDAYAEGPAAPAIAWSAAGLGTGTHTVAIRATGQKNPASSAATVSIDEATVTSATPIVVVDDNVMGSGLNQWQSWVQGASGGGVATGIADLYAGTTHWASSTALSATIAFVGSRIELSAIYDTDQRTSTVWLDGTQRASINMRSDDRRTHEIAWDSGALTYGSHTLEVRVGGQIALDFVRIYEGELDVPVDAPQAVSVAETVRQGAGSSPVPLAFGGAGATDVAIDRAPGHGTAVAGGLGVAYTPEPGFYGVDTFSYRAVNEAGASAPATATVYVTDPTASAIALEATPAAIVSGATVALSAVLLGAGGTP